MSQILSAAKWSFELLAKRIEALRDRRSGMASVKQSLFSYDESQMKESDAFKRQQTSELEYDC